MTHTHSIILMTKNWPSLSFSYLSFLLSYIPLTLKFKNFKNPLFFDIIYYIRIETCSSKLFLTNYSLPNLIGLQSWNFVLVTYGIWSCFIFYFYPIFLSKCKVTNIRIRIIFLYMYIYMHFKKKLKRLLCQQLSLTIWMST